MVEFATANLSQLANLFPQHIRASSLHRSLFYLIRDLIFLAILLKGITSSDYVLLALPLSVTLGMVFAGLFAISHDCAHGSFSRYPALNSVVGVFCSSLVMCNYFAWMTAHKTHHEFTNHAKKEVSWRPLTVSAYRCLQPPFRWLQKNIYSNIWLHWLGSFFFMIDSSLKGYLGKYGGSRQRKESIRRNMVLTISVAMLWICLSSAIFGIYGLIFLFVIPQCTFYFWLSGVTYLQHYHKDIEFLNDQDWNPVAAKVDGTVNMKFGRFIDFFTHHFGWQVAHYISEDIPHYNLLEANDLLIKLLPDRVIEENFSISYLMQVLKTNQLIAAEDAPHWLRFSQLAHELDQSYNPAQNSG